MADSQPQRLDGVLALRGRAVYTVAWGAERLYGAAGADVEIDTTVAGWQPDGKGTLDRLY